jgi:hypothetical protein
MNPLTPIPSQLTPALTPPPPPPPPPPQSQMQEKFTEFVGQTLFGSMLASMRKSVGTPPYMHGGRTEEVFQQQLDQYLVKDLTEASADTIAEPMFDLFNLQRSS